MYSPKIAEDLIPVLYHTAKAKRMPMTKLVDTLIREALVSEVLPEEASKHIAVLESPTSQATA